MANVVIETRIKDRIKELEPEFRLAGDAAAVLEARVEDLIVAAVNRAKTNGRKTVQTQDF